MKTLFLDPFSGVAGDMFVGALLDLGADCPEFWRGLESLRLEEVESSVKLVMRAGIRSQKFLVDFPHQKEVDQASHEHHHGEHRSYSTIVQIIENAEALPNEVKAKAIEVFTVLGEAEAYIHNTNIESIHFHEVGASDSITDIVASCLALHLLKVDLVVCRPIALGGGTVRCAHGLMPVPAPATAEILKGLPSFFGPMEKELTTPTGAALLKVLVDEFSSDLEGQFLQQGFGAGDRDFANHANVFRASLYEEKEKSQGDTIWVAECSIDDQTGEDLGFLMDRLFEAGALDVYYTPIYMKKNRPAVHLTVLGRIKDVDVLREKLFLYSTTLGFRESFTKRSVLIKKKQILNTEFGEIEVKIGQIDGKVLSVKIEHESLKRIALKEECSLETVRKRLEPYFKTLTQED